MQTEKANISETKVERQFSKVNTVCPQSVHASFKAKLKPTQISTNILITESQLCSLLEHFLSTILEVRC